MKTSNLLKHSVLGVFCAVWLVPDNARAAAVTAATSPTPFVAAASSKLKAQGIQLLTQGGQDIAAAIKSEAWTWDYAFVPFSSQQLNDTTLNIPIIDTNPDPNVAHALAQKTGLFGRKAMAEGTADKRDGSIVTSATANRFAVAKSFAGIGDQVRTAGATLLATILAKLTEIVVDPPVDALLPGPGVLDGLGGSIGHQQNPLPIASFLYGIDVTPPSSAVGENPMTVFDASGALYFDPYTQLLSLTVSDNLGLLSAADFKPMLASDNLTTIGFELKYPKDISIPFTIPSTWYCDEASASCDPNFGVTTRGGVYATSTDFDPIPEPPTLALLLMAIVAGLLFRRPSHSGK